MLCGPTPDVDQIDYAALLQYNKGSLLHRIKYNNYKKEPNSKEDIKNEELLANFFCSKIGENKKSKRKVRKKERQAMRHK